MNMKSFSLFRIFNKRSGLSLKKYIEILSNSGFQINRTTLHGQLKIAELKGLAQKKSRGYVITKKMCNSHLIKILGFKSGRGLMNESRISAVEPLKVLSSNEKSEVSSAKTYLVEDETSSKGDSSHEGSVHYVINNCWDQMAAFFQSLDNRPPLNIDFSRPVVSETSM